MLSAQVVTPGWFVTKVQLPNLFCNSRKVGTGSLRHSPVTEPGRHGWRQDEGLLIRPSPLSEAAAAFKVQGAHQHLRVEAFSRVVGCVVARKPSDSLLRWPLLCRQVPKQPQHPRVLVNDWLGTRLAEMIELPVPVS